MSQHNMMIPGSSAIRRNSSTSAGPTTFQKSRMPSSSGPMRTSSSASAGGIHSQQGIPMPRRPNTIPLKTENISKIRQNLASFREEHQKFHSESGLNLIDSNKIFAQAIQDRASNSRRRGTTPSVSGATDITNDTEVTGGSLLAFDAKTGRETADKVKRQLDPVLKARKKLLRSMCTCSDCRGKKVKCSLSHHRLEDLLTSFPDAKDDIKWALAIDTDPKQEERRAASSFRRSPIGTMGLESFQEENLYESATHGRDPVVQIDELFPGLNNMGQPTYNPNLVVEGTNDGRNAENDCFAAGSVAYSNGYLAQTDFFRPTQVPQDLRGTEMQAQSLMAGTYMERPGILGLSERPTRQRASSSSNHYSQATPLVRSQSHQSTSSQPQLNSYNAGFIQQYTHEPQASPNDAINRAFPFIDHSVNSILASCNLLDSSFTCMVPRSIDEVCGENFKTERHIAAHLQVYHQDYTLGLPSPMRHVCARCWTFFMDGFSKCTGCGQETVRYVCGRQRTFESQLSSPSNQSLGADDMDLVNVFSYDIGSTPSEPWRNGNVVLPSQTNDGMNTSSGGFEGNFNGNFGAFNGGGGHFN